MPLGTPAQVVFVCLDLGGIPRYASLFILSQATGLAEIARDDPFKTWLPFVPVIISAF